METKIQFKDILPVQKTKTVFVLRIRETEDKDFPTLKMNLEKKECLESEYRPFKSDIMNYIIEAILDHSIVSKKEDLYSSLINEIIFNANNIAITTRIGVGNFVLFSERSAKEFEENYFQHLVGDMIIGTIKAFVSPHLKDGIIVGYSDGKSGGGLVLNIVNNKFQIINFEDSEKYYRYIPRR